MSIRTAEMVHLLLALAMLVLVAHVTAHLFTRMRQPAVIGEIVGGLVLGPTLIGHFAPGLLRWILPDRGAAGAALGVFYNLGMLMLVFLAGGEMRRHASAKEGKAVLVIGVVGLVIPFCAGVALARIVNLGSISGPHGSPVALALVFGLAVAVTSIPVISRIMLDLGILGTAFARLVLAVAVLEDIVLYVILAVILGLVHGRSGDTYGLSSVVGGESVALGTAYYILVTLLFFALLVGKGQDLFRWLGQRPPNWLQRRSPVAFGLVFLFTLCAAAAALGIDPIFGALMAGLSMSRDASKEMWSTLRSFSMALFVPVYFVIVGLRLDLVRDLDLIFFLWFSAAACIVKSASVWMGARMAGETRARAADLAVAMNARGGPGIVLATVTFGAGIINEAFFTTLVLLSIVTSQLAGFWLERTMARPRTHLRDSEESAETVEREEVDVAATPTAGGGTVRVAAAVGHAAHCDAGGRDLNGEARTMTGFGLPARLVTDGRRGGEQ